MDCSGIILHDGFIPAPVRCAKISFVLLSFSTRNTLVLFSFPDRPCLLIKVMPFDQGNYTWIAPFLRR